ncbi:MAG: hypothetical protein Hals2KO_15320 [Halioglobus sp.]
MPNNNAFCSFALWSALATLCFFDTRIAVASAVFDGSIGPNTAGSIRSGSFEISESDGVRAGNNLFHSFHGFDIGNNETATFSHTTSTIENIVSRVTGTSPTFINGGLQVRLSNGRTLSPSSASLWLMNPNGILIGDGAALDAQSSFVFSTANRIGFANGDNFYSHDVSESSILSVADISSFGFLDSQDLPSSVTPAGIVVSLQDPTGSNAPIFLSDTILVGSSADPSIPGVVFSGEVALPSQPSGLPVPTDSSQVQALRLGIASLGAGGELQIGGGELPSADPGAALGSVVIQNSNILLSDNGVAPSSDLAILAGDLTIDNSYIDSFSLAVPTNVSIRAISTFTLSGSVLQTSTTTDADAGDIRIDTGSYSQFGGLIASQALDLGTVAGDAGNIIFGGSASLTLDSFVLQTGQIQSIGASTSNAGDIVIRGAGTIDLMGSETFPSQITSLNNGLGNAGDIIVIGQTIESRFSELFSAGLNSAGANLIALSAGSGGIQLDDTSLSSIPSDLGTGAAIALSSDGDITLRSTNQQSTITTGTNGNFDSGSISVEALGDLLVTGAFDISSGNLFSDPTGLGSGGDILLSGQNITLEHSSTEFESSQIRSVTASAGNGASINLEALESLTIQGSYDISSNTIGSGVAGSVVLQASNIDVASSSGIPTILSSSSVGIGDAGLLQIDAQETLSMSGVTLTSVGVDAGAAGVIELTGTTVAIDDATIATATQANDINDRPALVSVTSSGDLTLTRSRLQSNTAGTSPAGQVRLIASESLLLDNTSLQTGSLGDGESGNINVSAREVYISGPDSELLTNSQGATSAGDVNVRADEVLQLTGGGFIQTSAEGQGDAGTIVLEADQLLVRDGRIEGTSVNGGGGDINLFGRNIRLDADLRAGEVLVITTNSESSDEDGNGGSITLGRQADPAKTIVVRNSLISASANAGNGGRINVNAEAFIRDAASLFLVTSTLGQQGSLEINSPEQDISAAVNELDVSLLDATDLIQEHCAANPEDRSSLIIADEGVVSERYDDYMLGIFEPIDHGGSNNLSTKGPGAEALAVIGVDRTTDILCNGFLLQ